MKLSILLLTLGLAAVARAEVTLPAIFSDHMVLQRGQPVPVWGWSSAGATVTVSFADQRKKVIADQSGKWSTKLDPMPASAEPRAMIVESSGGGAKRTVNDVLVGEVWLCSGQSNMEMPVGFQPWSGGVLNYEEEIRNSANPLIRQYLADKQFKVDQRVGSGAWAAAAPETAGSFSAAGYFFARELQNRLKVPVAIINASVGATPIEAWISRDALLADPAIAEIAAKQADDVKFGEPRRRAEYLTAHAAWREKFGRTDPAAAIENPPQAAVAADTGGWKPVTLPGSSAVLGCRNGGIVWLRREFELPEGDLDALWITLPRSSDVFTAFVNGVKVHSVTVESGYGRLLHAMRPTKGLMKPGKNVLAIRMQSFLRSPSFNHDTRRFRISKSHIGGEDGLPLAGEWRGWVEAEHPALPRGAETEPRQASGIGVHYHYTSVWFDRMIQPLAPFSIKGALWYQGEHNIIRAPEYGKLLRMMIQDWRARWGAGEFPFKICQLPGNGLLMEKPADKYWAELREAQATALALPNTCLVNLIDTSEDGDLHPRNKQEVGRRLALSALAKTYGVNDLAWSGPVFDFMQVANGKVILHFKSSGDGLVAKALPATYKANLRKSDGDLKPLPKPSPNSELQGFAICGADRVWVWANAKIAGSAVEVWSEKVKEPLAVRYAWADHPVCNLYNAAGLPAFPFRTDTFPRTAVLQK